MVFKSLIPVVLLGTAVNAHVRMIQPVAYSADTLDTSPLLADGSDFPCKLRSNPWVAPAQPNNLKIGETNTLQLQGSAVHGGGSCQLSLTTDMEPTKDSQWMVIQSYEGGCPVNTDGNLPGGADSTVNSLSYKIPDGVAPGTYVLAWTWFNRIGNREMYMNCAPVNIQGGASKRSEPQSKALSKRADFPPMFVANVNGCTTTEGIDIRFPNPGSNLVFNGDPSRLQAEGEPACTGTPTFGGAGNTAGSSGSSGESPAPAPSPAPSSAAPSAPASSPSSAPPAPAPAPSASSAPSAPTPEPSTPAAPPATPSTPASDGSGSDSGSGATGGQTGSCDTEGAWNCIDGSSFQRCASGTWTAVMPLAAGTSCTPGVSQDFQISAVKTKRLLHTMRRRRTYDHIHA